MKIKYRHKLIVDDRHLEAGGWSAKHQWRKKTRFQLFYSVLMAVTKYDMKSKN